MNLHWSDGNLIELLINGDDFFPRVFAAIEAAREEVLVETFIFRDDAVGCALQAALITAAQRGVYVEVLVDGYGSDDLSATVISALAEAGVKLLAFDPRRRLLGMRTNLFRRLHRKIVVVDGQVGFVGGINFCADHVADYGPMAKQDYAVQVRGAIVTALRQATLKLMDETRHAPRLAPPSPACDVPLQPDSTAARIALALRDNQAHRDDIEEQYLTAIEHARERIVIANAYFFPSYQLLRALRDAARRGVQVTLLLQGVPDMPLVRLCSRLLYNYLLNDGVTVREYTERPLHAKVALVDHHWATVGSSNLDPLSLSLNLEANLFIDDHAFNQRLHEHLHALIEQHSKAVTLQRVLRGYWWRAPLIFLCFHFLRHFPAWIGLLPAHSPHLKPWTTVQEQPNQDGLSSGNSL
ncbi:cardiolipin synthase ClsB [Pseudomonas typographi]|uniref:Cardiolipin synthase B n=1 Tax=Pseudomonas typographi TaxID=2715964 RepID=A0ABR7Z8I7_9PSED|nr:cardiolipin synthase ClsB [Pseudomonas typographi]MBD1601702.1 cardiolipin synthase ClsB [Pseudomonas typographi]